MMDVDHTSSLYSLIGIAIGSVSAFFIALIGLKAKKKDNEISSLKSLNQEIKELKSSLAESENRFEKVQFAFSVVFDEYEIKFKDHPESMGMLKSLRRAFED